MKSEKSFRTTEYCTDSQKDCERQKIREYAKKVRDTEPVALNKIVFSQFGGKGYGCNPRAICDEILRRGHKDWDLVWLLSKGNKKEADNLPKGVRAVVSANGGRNSLRELETARIWINNIHFADLIDRGLQKRKETIYINTFHGSIGLKKEGVDRPNFEKKMAKPSRKVQMHMIDCDMVDYIISSSDAGDDLLKKFYMGKGELLRFGDARNDVIINGDDSISSKVKAYFNIPSDTKILLYAPTFRDNAATDCYDIDYKAVLAALKKKYGGDWIAIAKLHPNMLKKAKDIIPELPYVIDGTKYTDMQELLVAADVMITDYSSGITDFMLSRKPGFMYAKDLEKYAATRGLCFDTDELPFPIALDNNALVDNILNFDEEKYKNKVTKFLKSINYVDDGKAAARIVDFIEEKINAGVSLPTHIKWYFMKVKKHSLNFAKRIYRKLKKR